MTSDFQKELSNEPLFLYISPIRLILLSIASLGLYESYWMYKNWQYIKRRNNLGIRPFWRGIFGVLFCHTLLREIYKDQEARSIQQATFSANGLATGWVALVMVVNILGRSQSVTATLIALIIPSYLCLVPVQNYINSTIQKLSPEQKFHKWSSGHIVVLIIGLVLWALILLGLTASA